MALTSSPNWLDTGNNAWRLAAALWRDCQEEMGDQLCLYVDVRLRLSARCLGSVCLQHVVWASVVSVPPGDLGRIHDWPSHNSSGRRRDAGPDLCFRLRQEREWLERGLGELWGL